MYRTRLEQSLPPLREAMAAAAERAGRDDASVRLIAVTKGHPLEAVEAALQMGLLDLGENRVEELARKRGALGEGSREAGVRWHLIGHVQSRKASEAARLAGLFHALDSLKLARRLGEQAKALDRILPVLIQVNTSGEASKSGLSCEEAPEFVGGVLEVQGLRVEGLMTMAPLTDDEGVIRRAFRELRRLHESLAAGSAYQGTELSMGMTNDYGVAIEEGSTMIRIGTALFGERE